MRVRLTTAAGSSNEILLRAVPNLAALYSQSGDGLGPALAFHSDGSPITDQSPAAPGETIILFATGMGDVNPSLAEGLAPSGSNLVATPPQVTIGGNTAFAEIRFAGLAPDFPGVYQLNVVVPPGAATNPAAQVRVFQGYGQTHPKITLAIRR